MHFLLLLKCNKHVCRTCWLGKPVRIALGRLEDSDVSIEDKWIIQTRCSDEFSSNELVDFCGDLESLHGGFLWYNLINGVVTASWFAFARQRTEIFGFAYRPYCPFLSKFG